MNIRIVDASHGWRWIAEGILIFRKNPPQWLFLIAVLFVGTRILFAIPLIGVIAVLVAPNFLAGLAHGAQALEQGKPLRLGYLASGFLKNATQLITIGAVSLVGQFLMLMAMLLVGGDGISTVSKTMAAGTATPETMAAMHTAAPRMMMAMIVGIGVALPLIMAVWFAPLLVFFDDVKPLPALVASLWACLKNILPLLIYGLAVLVPMVILAPLSLAMRQPDLGLWLLAPILVPSLYASYKDLFVNAPAVSR
jgi:uncharacterized membrane protein